MSNANQLLYFVSQSYKQVQLSVDKGTQPYPYSQFASQFNTLLAASPDEDYARNLTILLVEEAGVQQQNTDYLRHEMDFEAKAVNDRTKAIEEDKETSGADLYHRRLVRL